MHYAVVDIETTGNNMNVDEIIQIGVVIMDEHHILDTYETFIYTDEPIPAFIESLTGINNEMLEHAPTFSSIAESLYRRLENKVFVAHNINFDLNFLSIYFEKAGFNFKPKYLIDTVDLFKIIYPCAGSYQLSSLAEQLKIEMNQVHHALADAKATAEIMLLGIHKLSTMPRQTLIDLYHLSKTLKYDIDSLLFTLIEQHHDKHQFQEKLGIYYFNLSQDIQVIDYEGSLKSMYQTVVEKNHLNYREEQLFLIETIYENMVADATKLIEAEVGSGKSLAYLIAAVYYSIHHEDNILITTATKALQHQLQYNDAPLIESALQQNLPTVILKSKRNYLSIEFVRFLLDDKKTNHDILLLKMQLLVFMLEPLSGDIEQLNITGGRKVYFELMKALYRPKQDTYLYQDIKHFSHPMIGITNHAHLLHSGSEGFPKYFKHLIIDEGHQLQEVALNHTYDKLTYQNIKFQLSQLTKDDSMFQSELKKKLQNDKDIYKLYQLNEMIGDLERFIDEWFDKLAIVDNNLSFHNIHSSYQSELNQIVETIDILSHSLQSVAISSIALRQYQFIARQFHAIHNAMEKNNMIFYTITNSNKATLSIYIKQRKINDVFKQLMTITFDSITLLSGTLMLDESLEYLEPMLGSKSHDIVTFDPMHREANVTFFVPTDMPDFNYRIGDDYVEQVVMYITSYIAAGHSKMLVLFNNYQMIKMVQDYLMETADIVVIAQTPQSNAHKLMSQFNQLDQCILLGTQSFYEGLDYQSDAYKCVMIVSLPFIHPSDVRIKLMDDETLDTFKGYQLPYAATKLRQAAGRLIRKESDNGIIICLDKRILEASYHTVFQSVLSNYHVKRGTIDDLLRIVEHY